MYSIFLRWYNFITTILTKWLKKVVYFIVYPIIILFVKKKSNTKRKIVQQKRYIDRETQKQRMQKEHKEKRIGLRLTKLEHLNLQIQSVKEQISISKLVRKKLFNEKN